MGEIKGLDDLKCDRDNANKGTKRGRSMLEDSLRELGAGRSILVDKDGEVIAGNKTLEVAASLGLGIKVVRTRGDALVVVQRDDLELNGEDTRARKLAYADNRVGEIDLEWDAERVLVDLENGMDLSAMWSDSELKELLGQVEPEQGEEVSVEIDRREELRAKWGVEQGQSWGMKSRQGSREHVLFCGDAANAGIECDLAVLDPPFEWEPFQQEAALACSHWATALLMGLANIMPLSSRHDFIHWWVWDSGMSRFGGKGYKPMSGCMLILAFGDKRNWNEGEAMRSLERNGIFHYGWPVQVVKIQDSLAECRGLSSYQKPGALLEYMISLYSGRGDIVGDPFAGAGGLLVAAEKLGRIWKGSEKDMGLCGVILERMAAMGLEPRLKLTKATNG